MKTREEREKIVKDLKENLQKSQIVIFASFFGLKVNDSDFLRKSLRETGGDFRITKNSLLKIAITPEKVKEQISDNNLPLVIIFNFEDEIAAPKIINNFQKNSESLKIIGGINHNEWIKAEEIKNLATIPSKEELSAKLIYTISAPLSRLQNALQFNTMQFINILKQYQKIN